MVLGIDLGNFATKTSQMHIFASKVTNSSLLGRNEFKTDSGTFYISEGTYDTEYRKVKKRHLKILFLYAVAISSPEMNNKAVVGLPISQYRQDKEELKNLLTGKATVIIDAQERRLNIEDVKVYPEGLINADDGVLIDIGGRTTEIALIEGEEITFSYSIPAGTLNLFTDYINTINSRYGLDLRTTDAERILYNGLIIDGLFHDTSFALEVFRIFVDDIVNQIRVMCPVRTLPITVLGGGGALLFEFIRAKLPNCILADNPIFANALLFKEVGELEWQ